MGYNGAKMSRKGHLFSFTQPAKMFSSAMLPAEITSNNLTSVVQRGMEMPIRRMEPGEARQAITRAITAVCSTMGLESPAPDALAIAVDTVQKRFASIGANEILTAFQLYADGMLDVESKFYARLNLKTLGEVLAAYIEHRREVVATLEKAKDAAIQAEQEAKMQAERSAAYDTAFPQLIAGFSGQWQDIPPHWYDTAIRLGLMPTPDADTKKAVWQRAKELATTEATAEAGEYANIFAYRHALRLLEDGTTVENKAIAISKRLLVWQRFYEKNLNIQECE